jgi:hypothetical protein
MVSWKFLFKVFLQSRRIYIFWSCLRIVFIFYVSITNFKFVCIYFFFIFIVLLLNLLFFIISDDLVWIILLRKFCNKVRIFMEWTFCAHKLLTNHCLTILISFWIFEMADLFILYFWLMLLIIIIVRMKIRRFFITKSIFFG